MFCLVYLSAHKTKYITLRTAPILIGMLRLPHESLHRFRFGQIMKTQIVENGHANFGGRRCITTKTHKTQKKKQKCKKKSDA